MLLKLENIIVFTTVFISYFNARRIIDALWLCVCGLHQWAVLRVSYIHIYLFRFGSYLVANIGRRWVAKVRRGIGEFPRGIADVMGKCFD
jgi:hypothetical protein